MGGCDDAKGGYGPNRRNPRILPLQTSNSGRGPRPEFDASNPFSGHQKIENPKMFRIEFWTSKIDVQKYSKRPRDPHNRIRLEKLCPKVVSDPQNAGRMTSKRRFGHFRPIIENPALNVNNYD